MTKTELILMVKVVEWAQKHKVKIEELTAQQIRSALK
jgi:hypothetical protein